MAVEMVRQPSETPNIENVDDFMPIRYAYANQNGYVIGRGAIGTGIDTDAYTINGNNFIINSGRLVIQGVECDIKNEHSIVIDINASKRYYAVYLQVNLANNTSEIFVTTDELGTPTIDSGDDLTINPVGISRMVLFTFEATNGIISNVVKVIRACEYSLPYRLDENGILKYGDFIIPQIKTLYNPTSPQLIYRETDITLTGGIVAVGDVIEICANGRYYKFKIRQFSSTHVCGYLYWGSIGETVNLRYSTAVFAIDSSTIRLGQPYMNTGSGIDTTYCELEKISKVIE